MSIEKNNSSAKPEQKKKAGARKLRTLLLICLAAVLVAAAALVFTKVILPNNRYKAAVRLYEEGKYEQALDAFAAMKGYKDSAEQIERCKTGLKDKSYAAAVELYEGGKYREAIDAFKALDGYKDSADMIDACYLGKYGEETYRRLKNLQVGDTVPFGAYEQDNDAANGKEAIEWIVLEKDGDALLLISRYSLDVRPFQEPYAEITWEDCTLRTWMNETFLNEAFDAGEQACILDSTVTADRNPAYDLSAGSDTTDKVYILSVAEAEKYFPEDSDRQCRGTAYCVAQGAKTDEEGFSWWLLRTPGYELRLAAFINSYGNISTRGDGVNHERSAIRPVLRFNPFP